MRRGFLLSALGVLVLAAGRGGATEAVFQIEGGDRPIDHSVCGFSQSVDASPGDGALVRVSTPEVAVGADPGAFIPDPDLVGPPRGFVLPSSLATTLEPGLDAYSRAGRVLRWVARTVSLNTDDNGDQDAVSVIRRGSGRCSGLANAAVALLRAAGFRARTVSGLLVGDERIVPHRWLECFLPGAGWVPSDPTIGLWIVTPRHVVFGSTVTRMPRVEVVRTPSVHPKYPVVEGVPTRPNRGVELICRVINPCGDRVLAVLRGETGVELKTELADEGRFSGLLPGRWLLEVRHGPDLVMSRTLNLADGQDHSIAVHLEEGECF